MENDITLEERKKMELDILLYVVNVCDENNLLYFLGGGTLLGAVRHHGFIPWDDDIDIMLPREEYEKLCEILIKNRHNKYKCLCCKSDSEYYFPYAKIVDTRTEMIEDDYIKMKNLGIYVDVFPIDIISDEVEKNKKIFEKYKLYDKILEMYRRKNIESRNAFIKTIKKIFIMFMRKFKIHRMILKKIDQLGQMYKDTNTVACITGRYLEKEIMPKSYIKDYKIEEFEGYQLKIPAGYDEYLTKHYGDYMQLPPKEKQVSNHKDVVYWREER